MNGLDELRVTKLLAHAMAIDPSYTLQHIGECLIAGEPIDIRFHVRWGDAYATAQQLSATVQPWSAIRAAIFAEHDRQLTVDPNGYGVIHEYRTLGNERRNWWTRPAHMDDVRRYRLYTRGPGLPPLVPSPR